MEESCWIFLCCCCCCCCILPTAILVPMAIAGVFAGQAVTVVEVNASANASMDLTTTTSWTTASSSEDSTTAVADSTTAVADSTTAADSISALRNPFAPAPPDSQEGNSQGNSSTCEDDEILVYENSTDENATDENSTDENSTNVIRCVKKRKEKSRKWIVRITYIELVFNWMGEISYYTSIGALICGATQIGLALLSSFCCPGILRIPMIILEVIVATYFGLIYIGYFITIPLFGWPDSDSFFYPTLPHVGPPPPEEVENVESGMEKFFIKTIFAVRNSIFLALVLYMLMMSIMVFLGSLLVIPSVCFFMGILVGLTRLADSVVRMLAKELDEEFEKEKKEEQDEETKDKMEAAALADQEAGGQNERLDGLNQKAVNVLNGGCAGKEGMDAMKEITGVADAEQKVADLEQGIERAKQAKRMLEQIGGDITIPWWDNTTQEYFNGMDTPSETCVKMGTCTLKCREFFMSIFHFLVEIPELLVSVGIPSFVKFNFDILFLLTVLRGFSMMPSFNFKFDLPNVDLGISALIPAFDLFDIKLPSLPPTYIPEWQGHCQATTGLGLILNLIGSTFTAIVVISSDILSCLYDRQSRIKLLKAAQKQKDKAEESKKKKEAGCCQKISNKISDLGTWIKAVKASIYTGLVEVSTFAVLFSIGLIVNQATVFLVRLIFEMGASNSDDGDKPDGWPPCTVGVYSLSKILAVLAMFATLSYAYRVLSGHVHKDGIYILGAALVQEEKIFQLVSLGRLVAIVRVCYFSLLLPFLSLGLQAKHLVDIGANLNARRGSLDEAVKKIKTGDKQFKLNDEKKVKLLESKVAERAQRLTEFERTGSELPELQGGSNKFTDVKRSFAARYAMTQSLFDLALNERGDENEMLLERKKGHSDLRSVNDFHLLEFTECCANMQAKRTTWYHPFLAMLGAPFGRMSNEDAIANRMAERCSIWQAQAESVHKASSYIHGIVLFLIPVGGTVAGKGLQVMSDSPGLFTAKEKEICEYSFYQERGEEGPQLVPSLWRRISYFIGVLRVVCSILTISLRNTPVFWAMSQTNSALAMAQEKCKRRDDEENKINIARRYTYLQENPEVFEEENRKKRVLEEENRKKRVLEEENRKKRVLEEEKKRVLEEENRKKRSQPAPQSVGGQDEQNDVESPSQHEQEGNHAMSVVEEEERGNSEDVSVMEEEERGNSEDEAAPGHNSLDEIEPQFNFSEDEEAPSPKSKAKAKAKKSKAKGKAKSKPKAKP